MGARNHVVVGRYTLFLPELASGGMGGVYLGRLAGAAGFARTVAIKRLHSHLATNDEFVTMLVDEARIASPIHHPNVVPTLDVVQEGGELLLVMEYVHGEPLSRLAHLSAAAGRPVPVAVAVAIVASALHGLHAAHEARSERGAPLRVVHRDVSPQNIMVGADGVARVVDFGVAKAALRSTVTGGGIIKGKVAYMAPEQLGPGEIDRRVDVFAAAAVLWELLAGRRLFAADSPMTAVQMVLEGNIPALESLRSGLPSALDRAVMRGLSRSPAERFQTALEMAVALERALAPATQFEVAAWVAEVAYEELRSRAGRLAQIESSFEAPSLLPPPAPPTARPR